MCQVAPYTMSVPASQLTGRTVPKRLTLVNSVWTVRAEEGDRLRAYIEARWPRSKGGMRGFGRASGITPETIYSWFRGDTSPSWENLGVIASTLEVKRFQLVAAMDGEAPVVRLDSATREALRQEIRSIEPSILRA